MFISPESSIKNVTFLILYGPFKDHFCNMGEILVIVGMLKREIMNFLENCFPLAHKYSTRVQMIDDWPRRRNA